MDKFDWFKNEFNVLSASEQIDIYNRYCDINGRDGQIFPMSDINEFFVGCTPLDILVKASNCDFDATDDYFALDMNGFTSFNDVELYLSDDLHDIYSCKQSWEKDIDEGGFFDEIYEEFYNEMPSDLDDDEYYSLIEKAVKEYEFESDIANYLKQNLKQE